MAKEHYDRKTFFEVVRKAPFPGRLTQAQVDGMEMFLTFWEPMPFTDRRWLAYCLGTQPIETGWTMQPIEEYGKGQGYAYGKADSQTGKVYAGRGFVQLTWKANYSKATKRLRELGLLEGDLVSNPELALDPKTAADIMVYGMAEGWFTGHKLADYFNDSKTDWINARQIVNAMDRANEIASHSKNFYEALSKAATAAEPVQPAPPADALPSGLDRYTNDQLIEELLGRPPIKDVMVQYGLKDG